MQARRPRGASNSLKLGNLIANREVHPNNATDTLTREASLQLLNAEQLQQIETHLDGALSRCFAADELTLMNGIIRNAVLSGGKRLRPQICLWTFQQCTGGDAFSQTMLDLACGWELFHAFLLAHDDIIDDADTRRGRPSLHRELSSLDSQSRTFGRNLGIVAGDLLFTAAMQLWHELDLPHQTYRQSLQLFSRIACTTGFGQAIDVCLSHATLDAAAEELLLREYMWKTAAYTFEGPMLSAAIVARLNAESQKPISDFALALGQAYQLHNDLLDLSRPATLGGDLMQRKHTVTIAQARSQMSVCERKAFDARWSDCTLVEAEALRQELIDSGAVAQTQQSIDQLLATAADAANASALPSQLSTALSNLLASLRNRYFPIESATGHRLQSLKSL